MEVAKVIEMEGSESDWTAMLQQHEIPPVPETRPRKRRRKGRTPPPPVEKKFEQVELIKGSIEIDFGDLDSLPITTLLDAGSDEVVLPMRIQLTPQDDGNLSHLLTLTPAAAETTPMLALQLAASPLLIEELTLVANLQADERQRKSVIQGWYEQCAIFRLHRDPRGLICVSLDYTISGPLQNTFSERSLAISIPWFGVLAHVCPQGKPNPEQHPITYHEFNDYLHRPAKDTAMPSAVQHEALTCELLPFQKRAAQWLLEREAVKLTESGEMVPVQQDLKNKIPATFFETTLPDGDRAWVSHVLGIITRDLEAAHQFTSHLRGGLLAEEMGLGKTVELISLICLHRRQFVPGATVFDADRKKPVHVTGATLVVVPNTLVHQWKNEIAQHAPTLKCFEYRGVLHHKDYTPDLTEEELAATLRDYDVVITTYNVLSSEIHFTAPPPDRELRGTRVHIRRTSPLLTLSWWRVCLDEAQMVDGGHTQAAIVARRIPRVNAWAASGTPLRRGIKDAYGLLCFLKIEPFAGDPGGAFKRLIDYNALALKSIFSLLGLRHSKQFVDDEIRLPPQRRVVINLPFTLIEEQNYNSLFAQMCRELDVDGEGNPMVPDWKVENYTDIMRSWLVRLRQTCTHPETGVKNRKAFGGKNGVLRTIGEVLETMMEKHETEWRGMERELCLSRIRRAQILMEEQQQRQALEVLKETLGILRPIIEECRAAVKEEIRALEEAGKKVPKQEEDYEEEELQDDSTADAKRTKLGAARVRLRGFMDLQHGCYFWIATAYHQLTEDDSDGKRKKGPDEEVAECKKFEEEYYEKAKAVRLELMAETREKAIRTIELLKHKAQKQDFITFPDIPEPGPGGIESQTILTEVDYLADLLNSQTTLLDDWREELIKLLTRPIFDQETTETTGTELADSVQENEKSFTYLLGIKLLLTYRDQHLTGTKNFLASHEIEMQLEHPAGIDHHILSHLARKSERFRPTEESKPLRTLLADLTRIATRRETGRSGLEASIAATRAKDLSKIFDLQCRLVSDCLNRELRALRTTLNAKMDYYRQLQYVSDTVEELNLPAFYGVNSPSPDLHHRITNKEALLSRRIANAKARHRYFQHLRSSSGSESPDCLICLEKFEEGVLTSCGHAFCKRDLMLWHAAHRTCPSCKAKISSSDMFHITYRTPTSVVTPTRRRVSGGATQLYTPCPPDLLQTIMAIPLTVSYSSKLDLLTKHLLLLTRSPTTRCLVFSQFSEVLAVLELSLTAHGISYTSPALSTRRRTKGSGDDEAQVYLLHARSQSAGLTLVKARHVFFLEPVLNRSVEAQAVGRVHRIGQKGETTVWGYVVGGSVEEGVMGVRERKGAAASVHKVASTDEEDEEMEKAGENNEGEMEAYEVKKVVDKGGEIVEDGDLWECLFGIGRERRNKEVMEGRKGVETGTDLEVR